MAYKTKRLERREVIKQLAVIGLSGMLCPQLLLKKLDTFLSVHNKTRIQLVAVGGGATNILNRFVDKHNHDFRAVSLNSDALWLEASRADLKIQIGKRLCEGHGCGANPLIGTQAALEQSEHIIAALRGSRANIIIAGLGGGTGSGAGPLVAEWSKASGLDTFAVVTMPFGFEGQRRLDRAANGLREFQRRIRSVYVHHSDWSRKYQWKYMIEGFKINDEMVGTYCRTLIKKIKQ